MVLTYPYEMPQGGWYGFDSRPPSQHRSSMTLLVTDLEQFGQMALEEFDREVAQGNGTDDWSLERHAQRLEAKLEQLYAVAATMARRELELKGVAAIWARMVAVCDEMAQALAKLRGERPIRSDSYDRILDIRNACEENRALHA